MNILSSEYIQSWADVDPKFENLAWPTYQSRYSRWMEAEGRYERWFETVGRVVNGNFQLEMDRLAELIQRDTNAEHDVFDYRSMKEEAKKAYEGIFWRRWLPAGRGLWCSGTELSRENGACLTNCFYVDVKPDNGRVSEPFEFAFDMLMLGAGVGFGVNKANIDLIPAVERQIDIVFDDLPFGGVWVPHTIGDSREEWVKALGVVIDSHFAGGPFQNICFDTSKIRPKGTRIKRFGGKASGPAPLIELLNFVNGVLNGHVGRKLSSVDVLDIMTYIGRCVVAGNVRRSAMIALGDADDTAFVEAKTWITDARTTKEKYRNWAISNHRWISNNSIIVTGETDLSGLIQNVQQRGEPGFVNLDTAQQFGRLLDGPNNRPDLVHGVNPCGEIALESHEPCNLVEVFPSRCNSIKEIAGALQAACAYAKRVTLAKYPNKKTQEVVERNRRIGVSLSGIYEAGLSLRAYDELYKVVQHEDWERSHKWQIPASIKLTTIKPSGTISLLANVSPGMHWPHSEYYIRRMQFQKGDPIAEYLAGSGYPVKDAAYSPGAVVIEFPVHTKNFTSGKKDISLADQIHLQQLLQTYWADNQVSCTVTFHEYEKVMLPLAASIAAKTLKSSSFLPYDTTSYEDMPYEEITEDEYNIRNAMIMMNPDGRGFDLTQDRNDFDDPESDCKEGNCSLKGG